MGATRNRLPDPEDRAISHGNLAIYLSRAGRLAGALPHRLAAITYRLVSGHRQGLSNSLHNLAIDLRQADQADPPLARPRLADLLAQPGFHPLAQFLQARDVDIAQLQTALDQLVAQAREAMTS